MLIKADCKEMWLDHALTHTFKDCAVPMLARSGIHGCLHYTRCTAGLLPMFKGAHSRIATVIPVAALQGLRVSMVAAIQIPPHTRVLVCQHCDTGSHGNMDSPCGDGRGMKVYQPLRSSGNDEGQDKPVEISSILPGHPAAALHCCLSIPGGRTSSKSLTTRSTMCSAPPSFTLTS